MAVVQTSQAKTIQATQLTQISPAACPAGGCAAGQTLDFRASYDLAMFDPALAPNVQVCLYAPANWNAQSIRMDTTGGVTGVSYLADTANCQPGDAATSLLGGMSAQLPAGAFGDLLNLGFRIDRTSAVSGSVLIRVYQQSTAGWQPADQSFTAINVVPTSQNVFVANDASACGGYSPCYVNSGGDRTGGFGTGLKDAVDAVPTTATVLGSYSTKANTVVIDQPVVIQGLNDSRITYQGTTCTESMLMIKTGATVKSLTITDGSCTVPNRDLLSVDSPQDVLLEYINLVEGLDALKVASNTGSTTLRFSQVLNNSGYAIFRVPGNGGTVQVLGSNLLNNRAGVQADCGQFGAVDHNFWGFGTLPSTVTNQCSVNDQKRLGAPVLAAVGAAGVQGERTSVTTTRQTISSGLVAYSRSTDGSDFSINILNHGAGAPENVPFTGGAPGSLIPCSNYYDIFLDSGAVPQGQLNLAMRYNRTSGCTAAVESTAYCASADATAFPLWWYSPANSAPMGWNTTGTTGQTTTCDTTSKEIQVAVDATGRPDFANDLNFTAFVVGLIPQQSSVVITRFEAIPGIGQATIQWTTSSEVNTNGFYVLRSLTDTGGFERVSGFINHLGTSNAGANYEYVDSGLSSGTYYYRLEIVSTSLGSTFSNVISTTIGLPTFTPTFTKTPTATQTVTGTITPTGPTPTPTGSRTITATRTVTLTRIPTRTRTPIRYATFYIFRSPTLAPTRTPFPTRTITPTVTLFPGAKTSTQQAVATFVLPTTSPPGDITLESTITPVGTEISQSFSETPTELTSAATRAYASPTPTATPGIIPTSTPAPPIFTFTRRNWPWMLGLLGVELGILGVVAVILRRRGLLKWGAPPPAPSENDDPGI